MHSRNPEVPVNSSRERSTESKLAIDIRNAAEAVTILQREITERIATHYLASAQEEEDFIKSWVAVEEGREKRKRFLTFLAKKLAQEQCPETFVRKGIVPNRFENQNTNDNSIITIMHINNI